ncbi:MAG: autotransporter-associated beta strand repeat-containing protein, partial [Rhodanobacter sp.]
LAFNRSDALTFDGTISGTGSVSQIGAGTTTLTGNNTYAGSTTIAAGTLQLGDGGTTGAITGNVINDGTLVVNRSGALILSGAISGTGAINQAGAGTTILTGNNTYAGGTTIGFLADSLSKTARRMREILDDGRVCLATSFSPTAGFQVGNA